MIQYRIKKSSNGFSLVELMISMAIGLFLIAGVLSVYINGRSAQRTVDDQVLLIDNGRFALEAITADFRQAGIWGRIKNDSTRVTGMGIPVGGECVAGWATNIDNPIFAYNDASPFPGGCTANYGTGDVIEMRYTLRDAVNPPATAPLQAGNLYINSDVNSAQFFQGTTSPALSPIHNDYVYMTRAYYISADGDAVGDAIPSLHRLTLEPGPVITDQMLMPGVDDLQIQIGLDTDNNGLVDSYVDPLPATDWSAARSVQIWVVVRSDRTYREVTTPFSATIAGATRTYPNDGFRRTMVNAVVELRNL